MGISLNFNSDACCKCDKFSNTLPKKVLKFVLNKRNGTVAFKLRLVLLLIQVHLIPEEWNYDEDMLVTRNTNYVKIVFVLLIKVVILYI